MEVHFPHLTNGITAVAPLRRRRVSWRALVAGVVVFGMIAFAARYGLASTMNQEMIAQQEKLKVEVCYEMGKDINEMMYHMFVQEGLPLQDQATQASFKDQHQSLEMLTSAYANYCKG